MHFGVAYVTFIVVSCCVYWNAQRAVKTSSNVSTPVAASQRLWSVMDILIVVTRRTNSTAVRVFYTVLLIILHVTFSALTLLVWRQEEHPACKNSPDRGLRSSPQLDPDLG